MKTLAEIKNDPTYICVRDYLKEAFTKEALFVLRNLLVSLRSLIEMYANYLIIGQIDALMEQFFMQLKLEPLEILMGQLQTIIQGLSNFIDPTATEGCLGMGEINSKIYEALSTLNKTLAPFWEYSTRYRIAGKVETFLSESLSEAMDYIDIFIFLIDSSLSS